MLNILTIIGIVLLTLLGLILLLICLLLFVPVWYKAQVSAGVSGVDADAYASWLLALVRARYIRKGGVEDLRVYVFWFFRINLDDKDDKENAPEKELEAAVEELSEREPPPPKVTNTETETPKPETDDLSDKGEKGEKQSVTEKIKGILNQINYYRQYPGRDEIISATWALIKRLCKAIIPKKLRLTGELGLDMPHQTAYLFGAACALCLPVSGIKPNFEKQTLSLDLFAAGKISLWSILWPLFRYAIKRPIWPLIKKILRRGDANE
ncbi:MAG: hypothetical protein FWE68_00080 [Defluviitaleaceae bacterium]|nr:hypothetical protein [Defluviitaleaceae bacterium]